MLTLEQQQRSLLAILRQVPVNLQADPWLRSVLHSPGLGILHEIALWWQCFQLESQCRYTTRLLKRLGCFNACVDEHFRLHPTPPSIEVLSAQFLTWLQHHRDPLVRAVAGLELACLAPAAGDGETRSIAWDRNPNLVMEALDRGAPLPQPERNARYLLHFGPEFPAQWTCARQLLRNERLGV